uniref:Uncharacterized protein n=1 Tax=Cuerna arida TaxID=1464854 RepID=A0A1B6EUP3_9HEMI
MTGVRSKNVSKGDSKNGYTSQCISDTGEQENISVEEFRANVEMMNRLVTESVKDMEKGVKGKTKKTTPSDSIIDGNFLSAVFAVVFLMIICVSIYAFYNLFVAILKKFPSKHTEL